MICRIEALRYRCLRYVAQEVRPFQILVGPNGSGKSSFLDAARFLGDLVTGDLEHAIAKRTSNLEDLVWQRGGDGFELAVEARIPERLVLSTDTSAYTRCRYEVGIGAAAATGAYEITRETLLLLPERAAPTETQHELFPDPAVAPSSLPTSARRRGCRTILSKTPGGNDSYHGETPGGWEHTFRLGPRKSALRNLPEDESKFPVATWFKLSMAGRLERLALNSAAMRGASAPGQPRGLRPDGVNLPWAVEELKRSHPERFEQWILQVKRGIPGIADIQTVERQEDRHRYLELVYANGLRAPSWTVSDGTLRLLALTFVAYANGNGHVWLIEEPENGIHPRAVEALYQALSGARDSQIVCASHSPIVVSLANPADLLCFALNQDGAADIVSGDAHPGLRDWKRDADLGFLLAAGVLG